MANLKRQAQTPQPAPVQPRAPSTPADVKAFFLVASAAVGFGVLHALSEGRQVSLATFPDRVSRVAASIVLVGLFILFSVYLRWRQPSWRTWRGVIEKLKGPKTRHVTMLLGSLAYVWVPEFLPVPPGPPPQPQAKPHIVCYMDKTRYATEGDWWSAVRNSAYALCVNQSDVPASNVVVTLAVNPMDGDLKQVTVFGDVAHRITDRGKAGGATWAKSITFPRFPPRAEVTIAFEAIATNDPPGFPQVTSVMSDEGGPGVRVARRYDEKTNTLKWEAFTGGSFTIERDPNGKEWISWDTIRWLSQGPIPAPLRIQQPDRWIGLSPSPSPRP